jgi:hypothetical protein
MAYFASAGTSYAGSIVAFPADTAAERMNPFASNFGRSSLTNFANAAWKTRIRHALFNILIWTLNVVLLIY